MMTDKLTADDSTEAKIADLYADTAGTEVEIVAETGSVKATVTGFDVVDLDDDGHVVRRVVHVEIDDKRNAKITLDDDGHGRFSPTLEYETCEGWKTHTTCEIIDDIRRLDDDHGEEDIVADGGEDVTEHIDDETIEDAIARHDDPDHPDALTVDEVRDILAFEQRAVEQWWSELMDNIEDGHSDVVADTGELLILATGEHQMYGEELVDYYDGEDPPEQARSVLSHIHHEAARSHSDYNWSTTNPFVVRKPADAQMGQRYVEALVNGLQKKGLTPAQSWAVYGVHAAGHSRNQWAKMCGHGDHSAVSQALRKVNKETAHVPLAD